MNLFEGKESWSTLFHHRSKHFLSNQPNRQPLGTGLALLHTAHRAWPNTWLWIKCIEIAGLYLKGGVLWASEEKMWMGREGTR